MSPQDIKQLPMDDYGSLLSSGPQPHPGPKREFSIALSGGGLRATLFELGILLYLSKMGELENASAIVSVSGGSILAAHLATHWDDLKSPNGFALVAAKLIRFIRTTNIRNGAIIPWIRHHCLLVTIPVVRKWRSVLFLERQYCRHFGGTRFEDLKPRAGFPRFAFVATDAKERHRVAVMADEVVRYKKTGERVVSEPIVAKGLRLSLAVASSSAFPPFFGSMKLTYKELGLRYDEFNGRLNLRDGGVSGNLGIEVLSSLRKENLITAQRLLFCDSERGLATEPSDGLLNTITAQGDFLSGSAQQLVRQLGDEAQLLRFSDRTEGDFGLGFSAQTALADYRTDLDTPSGTECLALMIHGAAICKQNMTVPADAAPDREEIRNEIRNILSAAGYETDLKDPDGDAIRGCNRRPLGLIYVNLLGALLVCFTFWGTSVELLSRFEGWGFRPMTALYHWVRPERVFKRSIDDIADAVASAICAKTSTLDDGPIPGELSRISMVVGNDLDDGELKVSADKRRLTLRKRKRACDRDIVCEFVFRGDYDGEQFQQGSLVSVVGRFRGSTLESSTGYVDFYECQIKSIQTRAK